MKTKTYRMLSLLCLLLVVGISAHGQSGLSVTAEIPFDFHAASKKLTAGTYIITEISQGLLAVRASDGKGSVFLLVLANVNGNDADTTSLVFRRYADGQYFLTQVWTVAHNGFELSMSDKERKLRKELLRQKLDVRPRQVEIAALVRR